MMNFCTYFDSYYMVKGLALYRSLERVTDDFHLYVMAFDEECYEKLKSLNLPHMTVELISDIETPELLAVKPSRSKGEYCWTCGPSVIEHFLKSYHLTSITYLDSDLMFLADPHIISDEVGSASVAITEQGIGEKAANIYGKYCVQYLTFKNDENGLGALIWWKEACIDWCFQKFEKNRYADQKYLDEFPKRWDKVHIIKNKGAGIAPWNMDCFSYEKNILKHGNSKFPMVFFHMHGMKIEYLDGSLHLYSLHKSLNNITIELFFQPYADILKEVVIEYFGYKVEKTVIHDMPILKKIEYRIRRVVRNNSLVRWVWFSLLKKKDKGHGTKI